MDFHALMLGVKKAVRSIFGAPSLPSIRASWRMDYGAFRELQSHLLKRVYAHAIQSVPFYNMRPADYPPDLVGRNLDLSLLPILTKATLRAEQDNLLARPIPPLTLTHLTSGSTGTRVRLAATPAERGFTEMLVQSWHRKLLGRRPRRQLVLSGFFKPGTSGLFWDDGPFGTLYLSVYGFGEINDRVICERVIEFAPELIVGYPSAIAELAASLSRARKRLSGDPVVVTTAEALLPDFRERIESGISSRVYDLYGSQEGSHLALGCDAGKLHVHPLVGLVEIIDSCGDPVKEGDTGRVVVSGLTRYAMPLIRYDIGDLATYGGLGCACGSAWPSILQVEGRVEDQIKTRDGGRVGLLGARIFKEVEGIAEGQLVQREVERFEVRIVPVSGDRISSENERHIQSILESRLGRGLNVTFKYMERIERGPNGKFRAVLVEC